MKRKILLPLLLAASLLISACGAGGSGDGSLLVYRPVKSEDRTSGELIRTESIGYTSGQSEIGTILNALVSDPASQELDRSVPAGVSVRSYSMDGGELILELSEEYLALYGIEKTLTDYCIALSLLELDEVKTVSIYVNGEPVSAGLSEADVLLYDSEESPYEKQVRLYFPDSYGRYLVSEYHTLSVASDAQLERYVVEELLRGPNSEDLDSALPEGTEVLGVETSNGTCTVTLSKEFFDNRPGTAAGERLVIYSLVDSLTSLNSVENVRIIIDGAPSTRYVYMDLAGTLTTFSGIIGPVNSAKGELDINIYMALPGYYKLAAVPCRVEPDEYLGAEACAFQALLDAESEGGYISLLQGRAGANLVSCRGGICTVDLPEGFFAACGENAALCYEAIVATLCDIDGVSSVSITENGVAPEIEGRVYSGNRTKNKEIIIY